MMGRLYRQLDHALLEWKKTLKEVERVGASFWEVGQFERIPGVGPMAAHVFSAIIEQPGRFANKHKLWKYSQLGITDRSSDNKPLGYQRLDRRGNQELKNLSYHVRRRTDSSRGEPGERLANRRLGQMRSRHFINRAGFAPGSVRHARLNTQRKILETMWMMWLGHQPFDPERFCQKQIAREEPGAVKTGRH